MPGTAKRDVSGGTAIRDPETVEFRAKALADGRITGIDAWRSGGQKRSEKEEHRCELSQP
jgi:hypothetical protein